MLKAIAFNAAGILALSLLITPPFLIYIKHDKIMKLTARTRMKLLALVSTAYAGPLFIASSLGIFLINPTRDIQLWEQITFYVLGGILALLGVAFFMYGCLLIAGLISKRLLLYMTLYFRGTIEQVFLDD